MLGCYSKIPDLAKSIVNRQSFTEKEWNCFVNFDFDRYYLRPVMGLGKFYIEHFYTSYPEVSGGDLIKGHLARCLVWEPFTNALLKFFVKPGSVVVDVGAFVGSHTVAMSHAVGISGKVIAFEPCLKICIECAANLVANNCINVELFHEALGSSERDVHLAIFKGNESINHVIKNVRELDDSFEAVHMRTLDSFNLNNVSLIKIDVSGAEEEVLKGAIETIKRNKPIILLNLWAYRSVMLEKLGYVVLHIEGSDWCCVPF